MENTRRNGLNGSNGSIEDLAENVVNEDDILEVIDVDQNDQAGDVANELDMLDMETNDGEGEGEGEEEEGEDGDQAMGVIPERDDAKTVFSKHSGSVFCVAVDEGGGDLAVTGGEDDKAFLWKPSTGEVLFECTGHKDSVTCAAFSYDQKLVATGDLSGLLQVWDIQQQKLVWSFEVSDLEWLSWHPSGPILLVGTVDGDIWMWKLPGGDTKTFQSFGSACNQGQILPDGRRAVAGYADGNVRVWDLKSGTPSHTFSGRNGHSGPVTSISCHQDGNLVLTGSTDCTALLVNATSGKLVSRYQCKSTQDPDAEEGVEAVGLSNMLPFAATGTLSGNMDIWDIPTQICRQHCKHEAGVVKLHWHDSQPLVYTCTLDGTVNLWDSRSGQREKQWLGHQASILDMQIQKNSDRIVTTSDDHTARVFSLV